MPSAIATEIAKRTSFVLFSMGAGTGCDAQYLFAEDILGETRGHRPRHAKVYRDFRAEQERLQRERVAAFGEFRSDVESGAYPQPEHMVDVEPDVVSAFIASLGESIPGGNS